MPWVSRAAVAFARVSPAISIQQERALQFFFSSPSCTRVGLGITEAVPVTWQPSCDTELPHLHPCKQSSFVGFLAIASSVPWPCTWSSAPDTTGACTDSPCIFRASHHTVTMPCFVHWWLPDGNRLPWGQVICLKTQAVILCL